jgi:hypothetical protein
VPIDLIFDADCPNVENARVQLRRACEQLGLEPRWRDWQVDDPAVPDYARGFGSPTILVEGRDVMGAVPSPGMRSWPRLPRRRRERTSSAADESAGLPPVPLKIAEHPLGAP